jgi:hypothetical protein
MISGHAFSSTEHRAPGFRQRAVYMRGLPRNCVPLRELRQDVELHADRADPGALLNSAHGQV